MNLKGPEVLQIKLIGRAAKEAAELGDGMHIRSLRRRRQVADGHVLDYSPTQGLISVIGGLPIQGWVTPGWGVP